MTDSAAGYSVPGADGIRDRFAMFLRVTTHFHHHVGQMIYLAKEHAKQAEAAAQSGGGQSVRYAHTNLVARDWRRLGAFLDDVIPVAEEAGVKLALHPDDPPLPTMRGQPRLVYQPELYQRVIELKPQSGAESDSKTIPGTTPTQTQKTKSSSVEIVTPKRAPN
jgi:hypothetical protein